MSNQGAESLKDRLRDLNTPVSQEPRASSGSHKFVFTTGCAEASFHKA